MSNQEYSKEDFISALACVGNQKGNKIYFSVFDFAGKIDSKTVTKLVGTKVYFDSDKHEFVNDGIPEEIFSTVIANITKSAESELED